MAVIRRPQLGRKQEVTPPATPPVKTVEEQPSSPPQPEAVVQEDTDSGLAGIIETDETTANATEEKSQPETPKAPEVKTKAKVVKDERLQEAVKAAAELVKPTVPTRKEFTGVIVNTFVKGKDGESHLMYYNEEGNVRFVYVDPTEFTEKVTVGTVAKIRVTRYNGTLIAFVLQEGNAIDLSPLETEAAVNCRSYSLQKLLELMVQKGVTSLEDLEIGAYVGTAVTGKNDHKFYLFEEK